MLTLNYNKYEVAGWVENYVSIENEESYSVLEHPCWGRDRKKKTQPILAGRPTGLID